MRNFLWILLLHVAPTIRCQMIIQITSCVEEPAAQVLAKTCTFDLITGKYSVSFRFKFFFYPSKKHKEWLIFPTIPRLHFQDETIDINIGGLSSVWAYLSTAWITKICIIQSMFNDLERAVSSSN